MATRKPKVTSPGMVGKAATKAKDQIKRNQRNGGKPITQYTTNSDRAWVEGSNQSKHVVTDGRSTKGILSQTNQYGGRGVATTAPSGRMAIEVKQGNSGKVKYDTKNATTNLMTYVDENGVKHQSGTHSLRDKNGKAIKNSKGEDIKTSKANRRQRDYYVRVGLNNDQRSPEAIQRLRDAGLSDEEIYGGSGSGRAGTASRVTTG